ncbi:MAG: hypothetical protein KGY65_07725 [Candidatus Thermoplasmatota archaeon]|nr:hypothetical protein [Candidatus Thermoplasmatota archaeon]
MTMVLVLTLVSSIIPYALADETAPSIDPETVREVQIMGNSTGAEIRLLQLEKVVTIHIVQGENLLLLLANETDDTTSLEATLAQLELVLNEIQSAYENDSFSIETFIDLKTDATTLVTDFRTTIHTLVDNETAKTVRNQIQNITNMTIEELNLRIQSRIREYNNHQLQLIQGLFVSLNESLIAEYRNGNYSLGEIQQNISEAAQNMSTDELYEITLEIKEKNINRAAQVQQQVTDAVEGFQQRRQERLENRLNNIPEGVKDFVKEKMKQSMMDAMNNGNDFGGKPDDTPGGGGRP